MTYPCLRRTRTLDAKVTLNANSWTGTDISNTEQLKDFDPKQFRNKQHYNPLIQTYFTITHLLFRHIQNKTWGVDVNNVDRAWGGKRGNDVRKNGSIARAGDDTASSFHLVNLNQWVWLPIGELLIMIQTSSVKVNEFRLGWSKVSFFCVRIMGRRNRDSP